MRIGVDFDNTIVCYDELFHRLAVERGLLPSGIPPFKESVRNHLREQGHEAIWTELQGCVYGEEIEQAPPFAGVKRFFAHCRQNRIEVCVISHKTRRPYLGPDVDLHAAARRWLAQQGFHDSAGLGLNMDRVFLEETKQRKLSRIAEARCTHFIDDLPEFLAEADFPQGVCRILFDPHDRYAEERRFHRMRSWQEILEFLG